MAATHIKLPEVAERNGFLYLEADVEDVPTRGRTQSDFGVCYQTSEKDDVADTASTDVASSDSADSSSDAGRYAESCPSDSEPEVLEDNEDASSGCASTLPPGMFCGSVVSVPPCMMVPVAAQSPPSQEPQMTSVMIRHLPNNVTRDGLVNLFNQLGFYGQFDFLYLPIDLGSNANLGYAFVNLINSLVAQRFLATFQGFSSWPGMSTSKKVAEVQWSREHQGLDAHIARFRDTPLMHSSVPEECRPMLLQNGMQVAFPAPTRPLRRPRFRATGAKRGSGGRQ